MISNYKTILFDCDGVILNSNKTKSEAFYYAALKYGAKRAESLVKYHKKFGGVSRFIKFKYFIDVILKNSNIDINDLLKSYSQYLTDNLLLCEVTPNLSKLKTKYKNSRWLVVSGGQEEELRDLFKKKSIYQFFDGGIFGSPDTKEEIIKREIKNNNILKPAIYFGDSKYDFNVTQNFDIDFTFISNWTELKNWKSFCKSNKIHFINKLEDLLYTY